MDFNKIFQSKAFKITLWVIGVFIAALFIFKVGIVVGSRKANFSYRWGENYHRNFAGPSGGFLKDFYEKDFIEAYGTFGQILKIEGNTILVKGSRDAEKIIIVKDVTIISRLKDNIKIGDLKNNNYIVVIGEPNDKGQIEAKLIRVMPFNTRFR